MVGHRSAVAFLMAARAGVVAAQDADDPVVIPPVPVAEQESAAEQVDTGPALIPTAPVSPSRADERPAPQEPQTSPEASTSEPSGAASTEPSSEPLPEADLGGSSLDDPIPPAPQRARVPPARPTPPAYSEERVESGEVRIRQRGAASRAAERREAEPTVDERAGEERAAETSEDVRSRYRLAGGEWWFQTRSGRWKYYRGGEWRDFDPVTFVPLRALPERGETGGSPYAALRPVVPVGGEEEEAGDAPQVPPGYRLVPADAVDVRTGTYYGPGPEGYVEPVPDGGWGRRRSVRSMIRGFLR